MSEKPLCVVSKSEPSDACDKLQSYGLNAVPGEAGTDYVWYPHTATFGLERKTITNLLQSLKDRQLVEQAHRGVKQFDHYFILIEGAYRQEPDGALWFYGPKHPEANRDGWVRSGWRYEAVDGMLLSLALLGATILTCPMFEYARKISSIISQTGNEGHGFIRERMRQVLPPVVSLGGELYEDAIWSLCALPGCGPEMAMALLREYKTLAKTVTALSANTGARFTKMNGRNIGKKRIQRLADAVNAEFR